MAPTTSTHSGPNIYTLWPQHRLHTEIPATSTHCGLNINILWLQRNPCIISPTISPYLWSKEHPHTGAPTISTHSGPNNIHKLWPTQHLHTGPMKGERGPCPGPDVCGGARVPLFFFFLIPLHPIFNSKAKTLVLSSSSLHDTLHALQHMPLGCSCLRYSKYWENSG